MTALTKFDYLLNTLEVAGARINPAAHGYGEKRRALFAHVRALEAVAQAAEKLMRPGGIIPVTPGIHFADVYELRAACSALAALGAAGNDRREGTLL